MTIHAAQNAYSSFTAITLSDTVLVNLDAIFVSGAGTVILSPDASTPGVTFTCIAGQILPVMLRNGRVLTGGTATGLIALQ